MKNKLTIKNKLSIFFALINFAINFITLAVMLIAGMILVRVGILNIENRSSAGIVFLIILFTVSSLILGFIVSFLVSKIPLDPIYRFIDSMNLLAEGKYNTRVTLGEGKMGRSVAESFNRLAEELENTEMLRSDFINNFSHEFKTPIVSILGFSRLLKKDCATDEERKEYLDIIEEESERLSVMATNVLNMTKIENQNILTNISKFNLSEQIRNSILLLEKKWSVKNLGIDIDFDEFMISANEELLKEVWINLLDNAVKFTPENGCIGISINRNKTETEVKISNTGQPIGEKDIDRIFGKFYQGDTSHSTEGTGLGLAIAKKIVELHKGKISAASENDKTVFTVVLPV